MKRLTVLFYCIPALLFSCFACAMTPDNTAAVIRKNAQHAAPHPSISVREDKPYLITLDNNNHILIPADKNLVMPDNDARNIITHVVNYNNISESQRMIKTGSIVMLE